MIKDWLEKNGLSPNAEAIFLEQSYDWLGPGSRRRMLFFLAGRNVNCDWGSPEDRDEITSFLQKKPLLLVHAIRELDDILETKQQWQCFAHALISSAVTWINKDTMALRAMLYESDDTREEIKQKALEIVGLSKKLEELTGYAGFLLDSRFFPDLFESAADIQNRGLIENNLPGAEVFGNCTYSIDIKEGLRNLLDKSDHRQAMPSMESLILAYGEQMAIDDSGFGPLDPLRVSSGRHDSPADFIRGFTSYVINLISYEFLPNNIKMLSFKSIESFAEVFYPYKTIKAGNFIGSDWTPKTNSKKIINN